MVMATGILLVACQREESGNQHDGPLDISLEIAESPLTKVDVDGNSGACTWTSGDRIGIMVTDPNGDAYRSVEVNTTANTVHLDMTPEMSLSGYAVSPYLMRDASDPAPTGATPRVHYLTEYSMEGLDLTSDSFSNIPMMAVNNANLLSFYHVGGLLRLILSNVPDGTDKIAVEFVGMTHVCGTCTVTNPGTRKATTAITTGEGNTVTFTDVTRSASTMYLNVPLPSIDYSALTAIRIKAYDGSTLLASVSKSTGGSWGVFKHGYGRMQDADFTADVLSGVRLSSDADITLWKSKTVTRTATALDQYGLPYDDVTMVWSSSEPSVATVDASTGLVTAVGAGTATIRATATPNTGGAAHYAEYTVYVNAITGIDVENTISVDLYGTRTITATLTNSNNGTINGYPADMAVRWDIDDTNVATVASATTMPVRVNATTMTASVVINGVAEGNTTLDVSVPDYGSVTNIGNTIICEPPTSITGGTPYLFRGKYLYPGILQYNSGWSLTGELDGLASLLAAYGTSAGRDKHYFTWDYLSATFTTTDGVITGTVYNDGVNTWRIPTIAEWQTIIDGGPTASTYVNSTTTPLSKGVAEIVVNLTGSVLAGKGYTTSSMTEGSNTNYIGGVLLIPDGATIICARMRGTVGEKAAWSASSNCITYDDLETLVTGGCVFLPAAGYFTDSWKRAGYGGLYWSATESGTTYAYDFFVRSESLNTGDTASKTLYGPVRLVRN